MFVEIYHGEALIGQSNVDATDPPMGVASGRFEPTASYDARFHADQIEGQPNDNEGYLTAPRLVARSQTGIIECQIIVIEDYDQSLNERHLSLLGIPYPDYRTYFGEYQAFKGYWGQG